MRLYLSYDIHIVFKFHFLHKIVICHNVHYVVTDVIRLQINLKNTSGLSILMHDVISLPGATSYDKELCYSTILHKTCG